MAKGPLHHVAALLDRLFAGRPTAELFAVMIFGPLLMNMVQVRVIRRSVPMMNRTLLQSARHLLQRQVVATTLLCCRPPCSTWPTDSLAAGFLQDGAPYARYAIGRSAPVHNDTRDYNI